MGNAADGEEYPEFQESQNEGQVGKSETVDCPDKKSITDFKESGQGNCEGDKSNGKRYTKGNTGGKSGCQDDRKIRKSSGEGDCCSGESNCSGSKRNCCRHCRRRMGCGCCGSFDMRGRIGVRRRV